MSNFKRCPICKGEVKEKWEVPNWIFKKNGGVDSNYVYCKCSECGVLFREEKNIDYSLLYDDDYGEPVNIQHSKGFSPKQYLKRIRDAYSYTNKHKFIGRIMRQFRNPKYSDIEMYRERLGRGESFLDVGCRFGDMIYEMREAGANAYGIEPYIDKDIEYFNGTIVRKMYISEVDRKFDIIFYNNVFEHLDTPVTDMTAAASKLTLNGIIGLVFPAQGGLTEHYRENAFVIQAPQHAFLHTEASIKKVLNDAGLSVEKINRKTIEKWYYKSFFLQENIDLQDSDNIELNKQKVSSNIISQIDEWVKDSEKNNKGDYYHVIARIERKNSV